MDSDNTPSKIILYGHSVCPGVGPVKGMFKQANIDYEYINIMQDPEAAARVQAINKGNESVPTLVFPDGTTLTEPSTGELIAKLKSLGYQVSFMTWIIGNIWPIVLFGIIIYAGLRFLEII